MHHVRVVIADCLEFLPTMAADSIDSVVTDPPYHLTTGEPSEVPGGRVERLPGGGIRFTTAPPGYDWGEQDNDNR